MYGFRGRVWQRGLDNASVCVYVCVRVCVCVALELYSISSISHQLISGTSNDISSIWINPASLGGSAPVANTTSTNTGAGDASSVQRIFLRQDAATTTPGSLIIDEIAPIIDIPESTSILKFSMN